MWLAAENGMFLRFTKGEWMTTMPEHLTMEWLDSVKVRADAFSICIFSDSSFLMPFDIFSACFRVFYGENTPIAFRTTRNFTCMEL